ncbi:MAG: hypothetical protein P9L92_02555 [Candidatus Electryonea clarkiae]|nr:hypothetical protein [Candidatus Electryonea clarkiae]MDP8288710.1 hypothetical protein [Candidatus Electryonea clarkiae]
MKSLARILTLFIIFTLFLCSCALWKPSLYTHLNEIGHEHGNKLLRTSDGNLVILGSITSQFREFGTDILLLKTKSSGKVIWKNKFSNVFSAGGRDILETSDGSLVMISTNTDHLSDIWLIKIDPSGNLIWERSFGDKGGEYGKAFTKTTDGGYLLLADKESGIDDNDLWLVKTDSEGIEEWNKGFGGNRNERGIKVISSNESSYLICGVANQRWWSKVYDLLLIKINSDGSVIWERKIGTKSNDYLIDVCITDDDGYMILYTSAKYNYAQCLIKIDADGNEEWNKTLFPGRDVHLKRIKALPGGDFIFAGSVYTLNGDSDVLLVKTDMSGNIILNKSFGEGESDSGYDIDISENGGYLILANTSTSVYSNKQIWLIETDENGELINDYNTVTYDENKISRQ